LARGIHDARYKQLIDALAAIRRREGISQTDLAERLGKRQQFVSKYESGERRLDAIEVIDIGRALGIDVPALLKKAAGLR
jgi:transcriptional regulator with XRE-family HTH domain